MTDFAHLHVASGFSMRYGSATPQSLVERAAQYGQPALALTDRDGLYGAVRFVQAAARAGIAAVLGVDLAMSGGLLDPPPDPARRPVRTPARGGAIVDPRLPRVTVLAAGVGDGAFPERRGEHRVGNPWVPTGSGTGLPHAAGWSALCRLVTDTHLRGERGNPVSTPHRIAAFAAAAGREGGVRPGARSGRGAPPRAAPGPAALITLLGPDSDVGRALLRGDRDDARALLTAWQALLPPDGLIIEVVCHGGPDGTPGSRNHAARMLALADETGIPAILSAAVRHLSLIHI